MAERQLPRRLYKFRRFDQNTLEMLVDDNLYFADPGTFNDPLDTNPTLQADIDNAALERILSQLVKQRVSQEMYSGARALNIKRTRADEYISRISNDRAIELICKAKYFATEADFNKSNSLRDILRQYIEEELLRRYDGGIVSLAASAFSPLMWSHYGDQHRGICVGYSVPATAKSNLHKVNYGGSRIVLASCVAAMLEGREGAQREVDDAVLLTKAYGWRYEKEWRLIGARGLGDSPLELEEILFGIRCPRATRYAIVRALQGRERTVKFYEIYHQPGSFKLLKREHDDDELLQNYPRRALSLEEAWASVEIDGDLAPRGNLIS